MEHSESIANLAAALSQFQASVPSVPFDGTNAFLKNRYATLKAMIETARPVLADNGLSVSQIVVSYDGQIGVETVLMHSSGEWISNTAILPANEEKGKSAAQVAGSMITYLRRYSYASILGLYADEDTDGNGSQQNAKQTAPKPPQGNQQATAPQRPYTPERLRAGIAKRLAGKPQDGVTEDAARKLAINWKNITGQDKAVRHNACVSIIDRTVDSFKNLTISEVEALTDWLNGNPPMAREEAKMVAEELVAIEAERRNSGTLGEYFDNDQSSADAIAAIQGA